MRMGLPTDFCLLVLSGSKLLPHGGNLSEATLDVLAEKTKLSLEKARMIGRVFMDHQSHEYWSSIYRELSDDKPGLLGAVIGRAEAQTARLALLYAANRPGPDRFGPWIAGLAEVEHTARLRSLRTLVRLLAPQETELLAALRLAKTLTRSRFKETYLLLLVVPALIRRRILSTFRRAAPTA